jgi:hypothetical protein
LEKKEKKEKRTERKERKEKEKKKRKKKPNLPLEQAQPAAEGYKYLPCGGLNVTTTAVGWAKSVVAVVAERSRVRPPALAGALSHELVI